MARRRKKEKIKRLKKHTGGGGSAQLDSYLAESHDVCRVVHCLRRGGGLKHNRINKKFMYKNMRFIV